MSSEEKIIKNKVGLLKLSELLGSVSEACKVMGYSRDSFYRFKELYEKGGELALREISRRKPCPKNRVEEHVEKAVMEIALEKPAFGQVRVANELTNAACSFPRPGCAASGCATIWKPFANGSRRWKPKPLRNTRPHRGTVAGLWSAPGKRRKPTARSKPSSGLLGYAGHLLRGHDQKRRPHLSADVPRG